jgi:hypothetical protein
MNIALVVQGDRFPKIGHPVLEVHELPEQSFVDAGIRVPILILSPRNGMQVKHHI